MLLLIITTNYVPIVIFIILINLLDVESNIPRNYLSSSSSNSLAHGLDQNRWPYSPGRAQARNLHTWVSVFRPFYHFDAASVSFSRYGIRTSVVDACKHLQHV